MEEEGGGRRRGGEEGRDLSIQTQKRPKNREKQKIPMSLVSLTNKNCGTKAKEAIIASVQI